MRAPVGVTSGWLPGRAGREAGSATARLTPCLMCPGRLLVSCAAYRPWPLMAQYGAALAASAGLRCDATGRSSAKVLPDALRCLSFNLSHGGLQFIHVVAVARARR